MISELQCAIGNALQSLDKRREPLERDLHSQKSLLRAAVDEAESYQDNTLNLKPTGCDKHLFRERLRASKIRSLTETANYIDQCVLSLRADADPSLKLQALALAHKHAVLQALQRYVARTVRFTEISAPVYARCFLNAPIQESQGLKYGKIYSELETLSEDLNMETTGFFQKLEQLLSCDDSYTVSEAATAMSICAPIRLTEISNSLVAYFTKIITGERTLEGIESGLKIVLNHPALPLMEFATDRPNLDSYIVNAILNTKLHYRFKKQLEVIWNNLLTIFPNYSHTEEYQTKLCTSAACILFDTTLDLIESSEFDQTPVPLRFLAYTDWSAGFSDHEFELLNITTVLTNNYHILSMLSLPSLKETTTELERCNLNPTLVTSFFHKVWPAIIKYLQFVDIAKLSACSMIKTLIASFHARYEYNAPLFLVDSLAGIAVTISTDLRVSLCLTNSLVGQINADFNVTHGISDAVFAAYMDDNYSPITELYSILSANVKLYTERMEAAVSDVIVQHIVGHWLQALLQASCDVIVAFSCAIVMSYPRYNHRDEELIKVTTGPRTIESMLARIGSSNSNRLSDYIIESIYSWNEKHSLLYSDPRLGNIIEFASDYISSADSAGSYLNLLNLIQSRLISTCIRIQAIIDEDKSIARTSMAKVPSLLAKWLQCCNSDIVSRLSEFVSSERCEQLNDSVMLVLRHITGN